MNKRHRIFIAINLPSDIKKVLAGFEKKWPDLPAKWTSAENLHITLVFLGDLTYIELGEVCVTVKNIVKKHNSFDIQLNDISYGPDSKIPPRFIWANSGKSKELSLIKKDLQDSLLEKVHPVKYREAVISPKAKLFNGVNFIPELREFSPHITLARINTFLWRQIEPEERPEVAENIDLVFTVESIEVMESELKKGGLQYTIIESHQLQ